MKLAIVLGGKARTVELAPAGGRMTCSIDAVSVDADVVEIARGTYSILIRGESFDVRVDPKGQALRISVRGQEYSATVRDPRRWQPKGAGALEFEGRQQVLAPMPGKVVRVLRKDGEKIEVGQGLVVVEAMKMQNEVRSPKTGRIERIVVGEGQSVNAGEVLVIVA